MNPLRQQPKRSDGLWLYFVLTYAISWAAWGSLIALQIPGGSVNPEAPPPSALGLLLVAVGGLAPSISGVILTGTTSGRSGLLELWRRLSRFALGWLPNLVVFGVPLLVALVPVGFYLLRGGTLLASPLLAEPILLIPFTIQIFVFGPLTEEPGWRGFALDRLLRRWGFLPASLILGGLHGLWHLPLFFVPGTVQHAWSHPLPEFGLFFATTVALALIFTWLHVVTGGSVWGAVLFHATSNFAVSFSWTLYDGGTLDRLILALTTAGLALLLIALARPHRWSRAWGSAALTMLTLLAGCSSPATLPTPTAPPALPNPASTHCQAQGYRLEIRTKADGSQQGVCIFPDGDECDEWAFYRGACGPRVAAEPSPPVVVAHPGWSIDTAANAVRELAFAPSGELWLATQGGVVVWNVTTETYTIQTILDGLPGNHLSDIAIAPDGAAWVATDAGVARFDRLTWRTYTTQDGLPSNAITAISIAPDGVVWVGTVCEGAGTQGGLARLEGERWRTLTADDGLDDGIQAIVFHPDGRGWLGTSTGVVEVNGDQHRLLPTDGLPSISITDLALATDGALWATTDAGAARFNGDGWQPFTTRDGLVHNQVLAIEPAPDGQLWFGTAGGVTVFDGQAWESYALGER